MSVSREYRDAVAFLVLKAIEDGETEKSTITGYVQESIPWAGADDVVEAAHRILDIVARSEVERGSQKQEAL